ncbi:hypothetical protein PENSPDRAFT_649877 [Peniophora sp. CONT]|nr:hypothetical protein PENSPDRAFT_649877 [Peniophora sp. CONT]
MSEEAAGESSARGRGRGRGRSRGGLGKYLRARGRGHRGGGRPAVFKERLTLEGEQDEELDEEEAAEQARKFSRRQLGTNADRYKEPEPELDSDGEEILEPEVDLSKFLERQRLEDAPEPILAPTSPVDEDDVDHSLAHIGTGEKADATSRKGKVQQIEWDASLEQMRREKAEAEANRDLKSRFRTQVARQRGRPAPRGIVSPRGGHKQELYTEAPPLPTEEPALPKAEKAQMEDFLDDLLG